MNDISSVENNIMIPKNISSNELMAKIIDTFQQLPPYFQMTVLFSCLALFTYIIHEGYCITITGSDLQITKHSTMV